MDDPFILLNDRKALDEAGAPPWSTQTFVQKSKSGEYVPLVVLSPHRRGYFRSSVQAWRDAKRPQPTANAA